LRLDDQRILGAQGSFKMYGSVGYGVTDDLAAAVDKTMDDHPALDIAGVRLRRPVLEPHRRFGAVPRLDRPVMRRPAS
jgi:hypothetical protein